MYARVRIYIRKDICFFAAVAFAAAVFLCLGGRRVKGCAADGGGRKDGRRGGRKKRRGGKAAGADKKRAFAKKIPFPFGELLKKLPCKKIF